MNSLNLNSIQNLLKQHGLDGWLLYDFRRSNDIACRVLNIPLNALATRRFFYWIPQEGAPIKVCHRIEPSLLAHLPGECRTYASWQELGQTLLHVLRGARTIAMEYSPKNELPYLSKVDGGTLEFIKSCGPAVVSSAPLTVTAWTSAQIAQHQEAAAFLDATAVKVWRWIACRLQDGSCLSEWEVQAFIANEFRVNAYVSEEGALCAVNAHSANPHYLVSPSQNSPIRPGDFILIDLSCRKDTADGVYADITRVAVAAAQPTVRQQEVFDVVYEAQQRATVLVLERLAAKQPLYGYEVDDAARKVIDAAGYGSYFIHRTGHNLDVVIHGPGTHMDNFETHDTRPITPNTCFTVEPGIYLPGEFGVRLEYDLLVLPEEVLVTGGIQDAIVCLSTLT